MTIGATTTLKNALSSETEKILGCIHCGLCLPACPTYVQLGNENDSPRGRIYLMRAVAEGRLLPSSETFTRHIDLCLGCRACETACPAGVNYGLLLESARHEASESKSGKGFHARVLSWAFKHIFPHPRRLSAVFAVLRFLRSSSVVKLAKTEGLVRSISKTADFALSMLLSTEAGTNEIAVEETEEDISSDKSGNERNAVVLTGCVMAGLFKHINDATARVLTVNGCKVIEAPDQVCCGALHAHAGDLETARKLAKKNIEAFEQSGDARIVVNAAGCGAMLKDYGHLLKDDPAYASRAVSLSARVRDVSEFLVASGIKRGSNLRMRVTYDAPCHLYHAQRVQTAPQQVLASIPGLDYRPLEGMQDCCGGAGIYNLSEPEMSERILTDKIAKVRATGAEVLVTANPGCHMQLGAGLAEKDMSIRVAHVVELLDESYRAGIRG